MKSAGCRVLALDEAIAEQSGEASNGKGPTHAKILLEIAQEASLFRTADLTAYADIIVDGHRETWPVRSKGFRRWLTRNFFEKTGGAPCSEAAQSALSVIEARAHFDAPEKPVYLRVAEHEGTIYLDLCDNRWRAVEISGDGWQIVDDPPVRFRRAPGMLPLPEPKGGGSIKDLRAFLNLAHDDHFVLLVAWLLGALRARGPYPVLALAGEHGSAKSTCSTILRRLIDPSSAPLRALPREDRDLFIKATNGHALTFDNISGLPPWLSDTLCRLATGGGFRDAATFHRW